MPLPVLQKIKQLVDAGATVMGPKPTQDPGLYNYPQCDAEVKQLADAIWGKVHTNTSVREVLQAKSITPDFTHSGDHAFIDFIHRATPDADIYFLANRNNSNESVDCSFRITGHAGLWDAVTGTMTPVTMNGSTIHLEFAPFQSWFVVFTKTAKAKPARNLFSSLIAQQRLNGPWRVQFDPQWGGPAAIEFPELADWIEHAQDGIKYYSGTAIYTKQFDMKETGKRSFLDLGVVKNIATVTLNGTALGTVWTAPWRIDITAALKPGVNKLSITVANCWPNRLIGDAGLPAAKRLTRTNIEFKKDAPLLPLGLLGPVVIYRAG